MVFYFFQSISILFIIISLSSFFNNKLNINNNIKYIFSILIIITTCFLTLKTIKFLNLTLNLSLDYVLIFKIIFFIFLIFSISVLFINRLQLSYTDFLFILIYLIISILSYDRYFLDEDEFTYWGQRIKDFYYFNEFQSFKINRYHQPLLTSWQLFFTANYEFRENILILANSVILIGTFFYLSENSLKKKNDYIIFVTYFILFYLLINNLSFGFVSIYADPIVAVLSSCLLKIVIENKYDKQNIVLLFLLTFSLYFSHRLGIIFLFAIFPYILFKNFKFVFFQNKKRLFLSILLAIFLLRFLFFKQLTYSQTPFNIFEHFDTLLKIILNYILNLKNILLVNIYYSSFGISINSIIEIFLNKKNILNNFGLSILFWSLLIIFLIFINKKNKLIIYFILSLVFYILVIYIEKAYFQKLSYLVFGRYVAIFLLSYLLFITLKKNNIYILILLLVFNILITPLKSFGLFVPDSIYYAYEKNLKYKQNRTKIKNFAAKNNNCKKVLAIYDKNNFPKYLDGHYSLILNIFNYELFSSKIRFQDLYALKKLKNNDFFNFFDCIFILNLHQKDFENYNIRQDKIKILNL